MPHSDDSDAVQGGVRPVIAAAVQEMAAGLSARCRHRTHAAEFRECGFRPDPPGIVAPNDEHVSMSAMVWVDTPGASISAGARARTSCSRTASCSLISASSTAIDWPVREAPTWRTQWWRPALPAAISSAISVCCVRESGRIMTNPDVCKSQFCIHRGWSGNVALTCEGERPVRERVVTTGCQGRH
jgi:hypothetical protein